MSKNASLDRSHMLDLKMFVDTMKKQGVPYMKVAQIVRREFMYQDSHPFKMDDENDNRWDYRDGIQI